MTQNSLESARFRPNIPAADEGYLEDLTEAAERGDLSTIQRLLEAWPSEPNPPELSSGDYAPELWPFKAVLFRAMEKGNTDIAAYILQRGLRIELYVIMLALKLESIDMFQLLLDHGWDINSPVGDGQSPPCLAHILHNVPLVHWFLSHSASPDAPASYTYYTAFIFACVRSPLSTVRLLRIHGASLDSSLQFAAGSNAPDRLEVMRFLIDEGADIDAVKWAHHPRSYTDFERLALGTALHEAVASGHQDRVTLLRERGARLDIKDSIGQTVREVAKICGFEGLGDGDVGV
ncbi:MAG: hypothetical protein Q9222_001908 [Ikaeria aurantiellina]